jgi:hypothetical protein
MTSNQDDKKTVTCTTSNPNNNMIQYEFTTCPNNPLKIIKIQLELVNFTLILLTKNGQQYTVSEANQVQSILNNAKDFNKSIMVGSNNSDYGGGVDDNYDDDKNQIHIEIKLDPVNSVNTYRILV